ncbi:unnamed protein product [Prunus armeniaca]
MEGYGRVFYFKNFPGPKRRRFAQGVLKKTSAHCATSSSSCAQLPPSSSQAKYQALGGSHSQLKWTSKPISMASIGSFDPSDPTVGPSLLAFGADGNLLLADADGLVAWQTNTANKDVVGFKLLPNGNLVLHCSKGNFVWQSFDYPTDTLLVGQALRAGLVIWASEKDNSNGLYILVLDNVALSFQPTSELDEAHAFFISLKQTRMSSLRALPPVSPLSWQGEP